MDELNSAEETSVKSLNNKTDRKDKYRSPINNTVNFKSNEIHSSSKSYQSESSDCDISCFQPNQSVSSRSTVKHDNDFVFPLSPIFSPVVLRAPRLRPPSVHTLGTIRKRCNNQKFSSDPSENKITFSEIEKLQNANVFENLQMSDKDISWMSSMETPAPKNLSYEFNTVERATFFPDERFERIQPNALFSPTSDDNCGCSPLSFSSSSSLDEKKSYKTKARVSDVCSTFKQLEFKSEQDYEELHKYNHSEIPSSMNKALSKIGSPDPKSPVFIIRPKKLDLIKKKDVVKPRKLLDEFVFSPRKEDDFKETNSETSIKNYDKILNPSILCKDNTYAKLEKLDNKNLSFDAMNKSGHEYLMDIFFNKSQIHFHTFKECESKQNKHFYSNEVCVDVKPIETPYSLDKLHNIAYTSNCLNHEILKNNQVPPKKEAKVVKIIDEEEKMLEAVEEVEKSLAEEAELAKAFDNVENIILPNSTGGIFVSKSNNFNSIEDKDSKYLVGQLRFSRKRDPNSDRDLLNKSELSDSVEYLYNKEKFEKKCTKYLDHSENSTCEPGLMLNAIRHSSEKNIKQNSALKNCMIYSASSKVNYATLDESNYGTDCDGYKEYYNELKSKSTPESRKKNIYQYSRKYSRDSKNSESSDCKINLTPSSVQATVKSTEKFEIFPSNISFKTCLGKTVEVSKEAIEKAKVFMSSDNKFEEFSPRFASNIPKETFEKNMSSFNKMYCNENLENAETIITSVEALNGLNEPVQNMTLGFTTGSGKSIKVNSEALIKAKKLLNSCEENPKNELDISASSQSFRTKYSDEFLGQSDIFLPKDNENMENQNNRKESMNICFNTKLADRSNIRFTNCLGEKLEITRKALDRAKCFLDDCEKPLELNSNLMETDLIHTIESSINLAKEKIIRVKNQTKCIRSDTLDSDKMVIRDPNISFKASFTSYIDKREAEALENSKTFTRNPETFSNSTFVKRGKNIDRLTSFKSNPKWTAKDFMEENELETNVSGTNEGTSELDYHIFYSPSKETQDSNYPDKIVQQTNKKRKLFESANTISPTINNTSLQHINRCKRTSGIKRCSENQLDGSGTKWCKKPKYDSNNVNNCNGKEELTQARLIQDKIIKDKDRVSPLMGTLFRKKSSEKQAKFVEVVGNDITKRTLNSYMNISDALHFKFSSRNSQRFSNPDGNVKICLDDGFELLPSDDDNFGVEQFKMAFLAGPGVQPNLIPPGWVENHYKWVVWKLDHYEKAFPLYFTGTALTPNNVMQQLNYRYNREIDKNERSTLKKILEKDDTSVKRMVLCICEIKKITSGDLSSYELNLTDKWYNCPARIDSAMSQLIEKGKITVGMKLIIQGAILVNCDQGLSPLQIGEDVYLKIFTNSTRKARWDTKLGFQRNPGNVRISLNSVLPYGGPISRLDVIIVRVYPLLYLEKMPNGSCIVRNGKTEEKEELKYKRNLDQKIENIYNQVQDEMKSKSGCSADIDHKSAENYQFYQQDRIAEEICREVEERLKRENLGKRNVSQFLKVKVVDSRNLNFAKPAVLSVWNPTEELLSLIIEGRSVSITNLSVSNFSKGNSELQINTTRQTRFTPIKEVCKYPKRELTTLRDAYLKLNPFCQEIDIVGMVVLVKFAAESSNRPQIIYLSDSEFNFVGLCFRNIQDYGRDNIFSLQSVIACSNLYWKLNSRIAGIPILEVKLTSFFTENPRQSHLKEGMEKLKKNLPRDILSFMSKCATQLVKKLGESKAEPGIISLLPLDESHLQEQSPEIIQAPSIKTNTIDLNIAGLPSISKQSKRIQKQVKSSNSPFRWLSYKNV